MCQLVATLIHLILCRYECRKFGFWGAFLAGRFCVYITQMNFPFYRFSYLFLIRPILFLFPFFYRFSVCFDSFLPLIRAICPIAFCAYCQPGRGGVTFDSLVNVPRYHVATLSICNVDCGCSLKCRRRATLFCGRRFCSCWGIHRRHRQLVVNTFKLTC